MKDTTHVRIESAAFEPGTVLVAEVSGRETISRLFEFELRLATLSGDIDEDALLTGSAALVFERTAADSGAVTEVRRVPGMIRAIRDRALSESLHREYIVTLVPRAWQATLTTTSDVCQNVAVPDILEKKLTESAGLEPGTDVELRLTSTYTPREFVVQYKESSFDFVCRLAEDLGIHFFFEEVSGRDVMVFGDSNSAFKPSAPATSPFTPRGDRMEVYELEARRELVSNNFVARDYNYRNPSMDVLGEAQSSVLGGGKVDEYGPHAKTPEEATFYAQVRSQEATTRSLTFEGKSDLPGLRAGSLLTVDGHPRGELDLVVTEVVHDLTQTVFGHESGNQRPYSNTFRAVPKTNVYRPARLTPKPVVHGVVTGVVESASPTEIGAIDDQGRYRVAFMYDAVSDRGDGKASRPLRMAQPSAGAQRGFHQPLKTGTEVIITCVNGDPDRPIIAGAVPNPQTPSPVTSANAEKSMWQTNVSQIAIDDVQPRCKLSVSGEDHVFQVGEPNAPEFGVMTGTVGNISSMANGVFTGYSTIHSAYQDYKTSLTTKDILNAAGVPNPWSLWKKIEAVASAAVEFAKEATAVVNVVHNAYVEDATSAKQDKAKADDAAKDAKKKAMKDLDIEAKAKPKVVTNADGSARYETEDEAKARTFDEALKDPANAKTKSDLAAAQEASAKADEELKLYEEAPVREGTEAVDKGVEAASDFAKEAKEKVKKVKEYKEAIEKLKAGKKAIEAVEEQLKKLPGAKLVSKISDALTKTSQKAFDATTIGAQKVAQSMLGKSGERQAGDVGSFKKPFNIQLASDSASLFGAKNAFVFGGQHATLFSINATAVVGRKRIDIKSPLLVEVAAKNVVATAKEMVDVHSSGKLKLVAHTGDKDIEIPGGNTMYFHSKEGLLMDSVEKDIEAKAKKNFKVTTLDENVEFTAKQTFKVTAQDKDVEITAAKGKIEIMANDGQASFRAKKKALVQSLDDDFTVVSDKGKGTVKAAKELNLDCQSGSWKASGNIEVKVKTFTVNGSKVELG